MNLIAELLALGAREIVAIIAAEPAAALPWPRNAPGRSPLSRGIGLLRRTFPELLAGNAGYNAARSVFRQQVRRAVNAAQEMARELGRSPDTPPGVPRRPRSPRATREVYTLRVEVVSQRGARSRWITTRVRGPAGLSLAELRSLAETAVQDIIEYGQESGRLVRNLGTLARIGQIIWLG